VKSLDFFNLSNPSSLAMALGLVQPLTQISTRNLSGGGQELPDKERLTHKQNYKPNTARYQH
jgi:hypothetical protein